MNNKKVCFISDAHFGIDLGFCRDREQQFFRFLDREMPDMEALYIIGDLFDFWIEYRYAIRPDYFEVLHHLRILVEKGISVHYLAGNHDFALGSFLADTVGMKVYPDDVSCQIQEKNVYMYHGDGLIKRDVSYRILKKLLRSPINQKLYKLLHPNIGVPFGSVVSGSSRKYQKKKLSDAHRSEYADCARQKLIEGYDIVLYGHVHLPEYICWPEGIYCNTGAWLKHYTYAVLQSGELTLRRYVDGAEDEVLPVISAK